MEKTEIKSQRNPVNYLYHLLNWDFIKMMAEIANYADQKYGSAEQYREPRLERDKSPLNHIPEHFREYVTGSSHDKFEDPRYHLAAIAYNAMMEYYYHTRYGQFISPLANSFKTQKIEDVLASLTQRTKPDQF